LEAADSALPEFGQRIVFRVATEYSSRLAFRLAASNEIAVPDLAYVQILLELSDEGPRINVAGSASEKDRGWS
jgi:hypothetical protein